jgi:hypothetical protein
MTDYPAKNQNAKRYDNITDSDHISIEAEQPVFSHEKQSGRNGCFSLRVAPPCSSHSYECASPLRLRYLLF